MFKKITTLLFLLIFTFGAAQTELKFNLASALILTPNIGIEVQLSDGSTLTKELYVSRGYLSSVEPILIFGLAKNKKIERGRYVYKER